MFFELDKIESLNFEVDEPLYKVSQRDIYKCNYKKQAIKKNSFQSIKIEDVDCSLLEHNNEMVKND